MASCVVCLVADGKGLRACACTNLIHVQCLVGMLEYNYKRCRVCQQPFTAESVLVAHRSELARPEIFGPLMKFCASATTAGREYESSAMLSMVPADCLRDMDLAQYLFERGRCLVLRKRLAAAENNFGHALGLLRKRKNLERSVRPLAWALTALAEVQIDQSKLEEAARSLHEVILLTPRLPAEVAEGVMRVVALYALAGGDLRQHAKALKTINEIVREECPCPVGRAAAYLEMNLAEATACEGAILELSGTS